MPASILLFPAVVIALIAWTAAWWFTRKSRPETRRDEIERLRRHAIWLEQRLDTARRERWGREMIVSLSQQLGLACEDLARAQEGKRSRTLASQR